MLCRREHSLLLLVLVVRWKVYYEERKRKKKNRGKCNFATWKRRARVSKWLLENRFILVEEQTSAKGNMFLCTN